MLIYKKKKLLICKNSVPHNNQHKKFAKTLLYQQVCQLLDLILVLQGLFFKSKIKPVKITRKLLCIILLIQNNLKIIVISMLLSSKNWIKHIRFCWTSSKRKWFTNPIHISIKERLKRSVEIVQCLQTMLEQQSQNHQQNR